MAANVPSSLPSMNKAAPSKLPVKRKANEANSPHHDPVDPSVAPSLDYLDLPLEEESVEHDDEIKPPPFKFHRIWTESDEIRFLQGLLDSGAQGLVFPRDLSVFYNRFSQSMSQPYTKSQLSEKLRRLRKKFRSLSARLSRGLDSSLLTPHDRALFHLSKQLWDPTFAASSPFTAGTKKNSLHPGSDISSGIFHSPIAAQPSSSSSMLPECDGVPDFDQPMHEEAGTEQMSQEQMRTSHGMDMECLVSQLVLDVFDQSLSEFREEVCCQDMLYPNNWDTDVVLGKRWRDQRLVELDTFARRLRLIFDMRVINNQPT